MSLVTCPFCGSIFHIEKKGCPNCTYRVPAEMLDQHKSAAGWGLKHPDAAHRTLGWFKTVADRLLHSTFVHRR